MSRIKWERAKALIQHHYAFKERPNDWPQRFAPVHLAHLQAPPIGKDQSHTTAWQAAIESAAGAGELPNVLQSFTLDPPFASHAGIASAISAGMEGRRYTPEPIRPLVKTWPGIAAGDFQTWLKLQGETASEHIAAWFDARCTAPAQTPAKPAPVVAASEAIPDPERRLALLRSLGGTATYRRSEWKFTGIATLLASEKSAGRKRSTEKTIRADLKEAAQTERDNNAAGVFTGLGQR